LNSKVGVSLLIIFSRRATVFHKWAQFFELNFFIRRPFLYMVKTGRQNCLHTRLLARWPSVHPGDSHFSGENK